MEVTLDFEKPILDLEHKIEELKTLRTGTIDFSEEIEKLETAPADYVAIVHGESWYELTSLRELLPRRLAYVGLLGSKSKAERISEKLISDGLPADDVEKIVTPIGIEIGAETPEEIAVSILAELIKVRRLGAH